MSSEYWEEKADRFLATRGGSETPRPLRYDIADWLERAHTEGASDCLRQLESELRFASGTIVDMLRRITATRDAASEKACPGSTT